MWCRTSAGKHQRLPVCIEDVSQQSGDEAIAKIATRTQTLGASVPLSIYACQSIHFTRGVHRGLVSSIRMMSSTLPVVSCISHTSGPYSGLFLGCRATTKHMRKFDRISRTHGHKNCLVRSHIVLTLLLSNQDG